MKEEFPFQKPGEEIIITAEAEIDEKTQQMADYFVDATVYLKDQGVLNEDANLIPDRDFENLDVSIQAYSVDLPDGYVEEFSDEEDSFFAYGAVSRPSDQVNEEIAPIFISETVLSNLDPAEIAGYVMHEVVEVQNSERPEMRNPEAQMRTARDMDKIHEYREELEQELGTMPLDEEETERSAEYSQRMGEFFGWF